jgi:hypothetical protein
MTQNSREIYRSPNGDHWSLVRIEDRVIVRHQSNVPSGGSTTDAEIADFLGTGGLGPEKQALLRMIGTLVNDIE